MVVVVVVVVVAVAVAADARTEYIQKGVRPRAYMSSFDKGYRLIAESLCF